MLTEEDVESWNKLFPDCQINKTNLGNPTEHFLIKALVSYLRRFGYSIEPPFNLNAEHKENNKENRLFLIKLARQIDHFLKITEKNYSFTYYDLIRPTPKKTAHMLYILLNYYYYYNLYKEDVFQMASEGINQLKELRAFIDETRYINEHRREENKNLKSAIDQLEEELHMARAKHKELENKQNLQSEELDKLKQSLQELDRKLSDLKEQKKVLGKRVVTEEEFQDLSSQLIQLKLKLAEHKEVESTILAKLNDCKETNANLHAIREEVDKAYKIIPAHSLRQLQETTKQLARTEEELKELQFKEKNLLLEIEEEKIKKQSLLKELETKKSEYQKRHTELANTVSSKEDILKQKDAEIVHLDKADHTSQCQLEEQKDQTQYLQENIAEIFSVYRF